MQVAVRARQVMDLQPLDLLVDRLRRRQQRRHRDERAQMRGHAVAQFQRRQQASRGSPASRTRLTSATAASMAGIAPRTPSRLSHASAEPRLRPRTSSGMARRTAATAARRRRHSRRCRALGSERPGQARGGGRKPIAASNARPAAGEQMVAGIGAARCPAPASDQAQRPAARTARARRRVPCGREPRASSSMALR